MLTLNDGRNELWQWDTGRKLEVDVDCSQVHFSNKVFGRSIDVDVVDGVATIPDILLQTDKELNVWAFVGTAENGYTKISKTFKVNRRNKPADYVFTPPEQTTLEEIKEKLDYLESIQDPDAIKNAVDDYLANNPIQIDEKDPTVPAWAKQATKPKYTATEVGAVAKVNGVKPDANGNVEITIPDSGGNVELDTTLTQSGKAADAKAVGDAISQISSGGNVSVSPLKGKKLSIIGDSISTFSGYIPDGYKTWYPTNYVDAVEKTWWYQLIQKTGMVLCKNASWSESTLCGNTENTSGIVGCSDVRVEDISGEDEPDIIIVFIGINDFAKSNGYSCGEYDGSSSVTTDATLTRITDAYGLLLSKLRQRYPKAFVCGCRIMPEKYSGGSMNDSFSGGFPNVNPDDSVSLPALNERIEKICKAFGCGVIPMDASGISFYNATDCTGDGLHPNEEQMSRMALVAERWLSAFAAEIGVGNEESGGDDNEDTVYHSVVTNLTNVTSSNTASAVLDNSPFTTTMEAFSGYVLDTVTVTMGGVDVTADVYDDGVVTISAVTGDIVITATAVVGEDTRTMLYNWDFTNSLADTVNGTQATLVLGDKTSDVASTPPVRDSDGVHFTGGAQAIDFGSIFELNRTYEIDVSEMDYKGASDKNMRFFTLRMNEGTAASGFLYWGLGAVWNVYSAGWGDGYPLTSRNDISGKTVTLKIDSGGRCETLLDGVSYGTVDATFTSGWDVLELGSSGIEEPNNSNASKNGCNLYDCTITGFRVYQGVQDNFTEKWSSVEYTEEDGFYNSSGNHSNYAGVYNTGQVEVNNATAIRFTTTEAMAHYLVFWDSNKTFIRSHKVDTAGTIAFGVPLNAAYFSVAYYDTERDTINVQVSAP